jgi:hypothetical protein
MRWKTFFLAAVFCFGATGAGADQDWQGPGWYVMAYQYAVIIWSGPYDGQYQCEDAKPADGDPPGFSYSCSYLSRDPD